MTVDTYGWDDDLTDLTRYSAQPDDGLPLWVPRVQTQQMPCGAHFDAVRAPAVEAERAHHILGAHSGPLLANFYTKTWYFLLEPGLVTPQSWAVRGTRLMRTGVLIAIPPASTTHGRDVRWVVLPEQGRTDPHALHQALEGRTPPPAAPRRTRRSRTDTRSTTSSSR
ncbi:hypothetical protein [Streptomyces sp. NPDC048638]|uniref:hypothetical protein n=1 Tax=Streptomyces sp. NPDC048638 TaxID=3365580 RepID=UPI00371E1CF5